jgi:predicted metalloprotease with PDZ domain
MSQRLVAILAAVAAAVPPAAFAQHPFRNPADAVEVRFARSQPVLAYSLRIDSTDVSRFAVEIRIRNAPDTLRLAMFAHPEYDDEYFRYVEGLVVQGPGGGPVAVERLDSALWRAVVPGGEAVVRYRIRLPAQTAARRQAWKAYLTPTGGLVGGPHSFMYLVGAELAPAHVTVTVPAGWEIATGLEATGDPSTFFAPSAGILMDSPLFVGQFRSWRFSVDAVPHRVVYWPLPDAVPFDTGAFVGNLERMTRQAVALFGRAPYREYSFLYQDGALGGLEHLNSVTLAAPSSDLAQNVNQYLMESAHEFIHTWNLMRIRPAERGDMHYRQAGQSRGLWWSEGLTLFYADLLLRRAGLPTPDSTRVSHLEYLISRYTAVPGNSRIPAERVSLMAYGAPPGSLGDYEASTHLQGEALGAMLDLIVRGATAGRRSIDDVMRLMLERYSGTRGFTGADIERTVGDVCGCTVKAFFDAHVRGGTPIVFDRYLRTIGFTARTTWGPSLGRDGKPAPDLRLRAWMPPGESKPSLLVLSPDNAWGRAGLHTGDRLISLNGTPVPGTLEFRNLIGRLAIGDTARIEVARAGGAVRVTVPIVGYDRPFVRIEELPGATEAQRSLRAQWLAGR